MAAPQLRQTDFLPTRFNGTQLDNELCSAHFMSFVDYLEAHNLHQPANAADVGQVVNLFKRTLIGQARLWIEGKVFETLPQLKDQFVARFSPARSNFANVRLFDNMTYTTGDSAEQHMTKIRLAATRIGYGELQICNRFVSSLPAKCQTAVIMSAPDNATADDLISRAQRYIDSIGTNPDSLREVTFNATASISDPKHDLDLHMQKLEDIDQKLNTLHLTERESRRDQYNNRPSPYPSRSPTPARQQRYNKSPSRSMTRPPDRSLSRGRDHGLTNRSLSRGRDHRPVIFCDYCSLPNHKWRTCRKRQNDIRQGQHTAPDNFYHRDRYSQQQNNYQQGRNQSFQTRPNNFNMVNRSQTWHDNQEQQGQNQNF